MAQSSATTQFGSGNGIALVQCPHPQCGHQGTLITKVHCRMYHQMEREELFNQFGNPTRVILSYAKTK